MRFGLERMRRLLTALGSPQQAFRAIHVVGTNGKSSTARFAAAMLEAHGVRAGAYLSPHLETLRRAHPCRRRRTATPEAFGAAVERAAEAAAQGRAPRRRGRPRHAVRAADRRGASRARRARGWRWPSSRPGSAAAGTRPTCSTRRWSCSPASASSTRAGSARPLTDIAREKLAVVRARRARSCYGAPRPREAMDGVRRVDAAIGSASPCRSGRRPAPRLPALQRRAGRRRGGGAARRGRRREGAGRGRGTSWCPAASRCVGQRAADDRRRRAQPGGDGGARGGAADVAGVRPPRRCRLHPRRQGRRGDAAAAARAACRGPRLHRDANPRALPPATLASLAGAARVHRRDRPRARPAARARPGRASSPGPTGAVVATGSIYLVADLLSEPGKTESEHPVNDDDGPSVLAMIGSRRRGRRGGDPRLLRPRLRLRPGLPVKAGISAVQRLIFRRGPDLRRLRHRQPTASTPASRCCCCSSSSSGRR